MRPIARQFVVVAVIAGLTLWLSDVAPARQGNPPAIHVEKMKYDDLGKLIRSQQGRVVVVDFWATYCVPCMREFPHLVALHDKYRQDSFVALSVAVDDPADVAARGRIIAFLEKLKAHGLTNLQLDEPPQVWMKKLGVDGPPCVYVFDRDGHIAGKWDDNVDYAEIEKKVAELLKK